MSPQRNKQLHSLLTSRGLMHQKATLVLSFSGGRTESSKELTEGEAIELVHYLQQQPLTPKLQQQHAMAQRMKFKIIGLMKDMGYLLPRQPGTAIKVDMDKVNAWCVHHSYLKKKLDAYTLAELPKLVSQVESMYKKFLQKF